MMKKNLDYIIFILMLAFTTFEYFFREDKLEIIISLLAMGIVICRARNGNSNISYPLTAVCILLIWSLIQSALIPGSSLIQPISLGISLFGAMSIAMIVKDRFVSIFVTTIYYIAIVALIIYLLCLDSSIQSFLINDITRYFTSLNVEAAIIEGGGKNFIIHNFAGGDAVLEATNMLRNCGPFWEPGMFAVFLNIALFLHNMVEKQKLPLCNIILVAALVTTFSTGGYICGLLVLLLYIIIGRQNYIVSAICIILFIVLSQYFLQLEFIGEKALEQSEDFEIGSDVSRFGAFLTQLEMIKDHPILGGARISDYSIYADNRTLASGTLLPFVTYGIPIGLCYIVIMLQSLVRLVKSNGQKMIVGVVFFILLLTLSFSQTILLSLWMMTMIFVGLMTKENKNYYVR